MLTSFSCCGRRRRGNDQVVEVVDDADARQAIEDRRHEAREGACRIAEAKRDAAELEEAQLCGEGALVGGVGVER